MGFTTVTGMQGGVLTALQSEDLRQQQAVYGTDLLLLVAVPLALLHARPGREVVEHDGGRAGHVEGGRAGAVLWDVHETVAYVHLVLVHALALHSHGQGTQD